MRRRGSEGRSESFSYRMVMYIILVAGAVPVVLPFYWVLVASLKTKDRVEAYPPDWLPVVPRDYVQVGDQRLRVKIFDDGTQSETYVTRVKFLVDEGAPLEVPRAALERREHVTHIARVDGKRMRAEPIGPPAGGEVRVRLLGEPQRIEMPTAMLVRQQYRVFYWGVLGVERPVTLAGGELPEAGTAQVLEFAPTTEPLQPIQVAASQVHAQDGRAVVPYRGRDLPVLVQEENVAAGHVTVRIVLPEAGLAVPIGELREALGEVTLAPLGGAWREVKPLGPVGTPTAWTLTPVEVPHRPVERTIPESDLVTLSDDVYWTEVLGQRVQVEPQEVPLPDDPAARVAVDVQGDLSLVNEAPRMVHEAPLKPQWGNFVLAWKEQQFDLYLANTLLIASLVVLGTVMSCGLVGYAFARLRFRGSNVLFLILLATMMIPGQVTSVPTFVLFARLGWIDTFLPLIVPHFLAFSAFFVFLYRQFMMTIPVDLEDSARIDGCGPLATWWLIIMPLCKPIIVTVAVFSFITAWNDFLGPLLYINSDSKQTIALGLQNFKSAYAYADPQLLMAAAVMMLIPTVIIFFLAQKAFMRGVVVSGVKG